MSKGGTTSGSTQIPAWLENAAIENINKARDVSQIGYTPYYGPDVAAFSPMQQQSMQSTGNAASAFGLAPQGFDAMAGMPQAETFAGGVQGYSSAPMYEQSLDKLFANAPAQYNAMSDMFIDPFTGARPRNGYGATPAQTSQMSSGGGGNSPYGNDANMAHLAKTYNPNKQPDYQPAIDGGTGYWSGGEKTGMQTNLMTGDEYESYVLAHGLPPEGDTFMDGLRGFGRSFVNDGLIGKLYESATGNPIMQRDLESTDPNYYPTMSGNESSFYPVGGSANNTAANRYGTQDDVLRNDTYLAQARRQSDTQRQLADLLNQPIDTSGGLLRGQALDDLNSQYALETGLRDEELYLENQAMINQATAARAAQVARERAARSTVNSGGGGNNNSGGSTYSGGGKAAASGYGGISGGGGK